MSLNWALAPFVAIGHVGIFVYLTNVSHAVGWRPPWLGWTNKAIQASALGLAAAMVWLLVNGGAGPWWWPIQGYALVCLLVAFVAIPVCSFLLHVRRIPDGIEERASEIDLSQRDGTDALIGEGKHSWLLRMRRNDSFRLKRREWNITLPSLPPLWDGLSIVQVSDLHFAPCFRQRFFELVVDEAAAWDADLVVFTGDLLDHDEALDWVVPLMSRLSGRLGTYAILGNHDFDHRPARISEHLERSGFTDLEGRWTSVRIQGMTLALGGTSYPWGPELDLNDSPPADFRLLLSHSPDRFSSAVASGIDLMLSGHNHGGQIRLPGLGPVFMPSLYSRRFDRGYFRSGRTLLHVSQGVAGKHPIRIGCVPEISRLVLRVGREQTPHDSGRRHASVAHDAAPTISS